MGRSSSKMMEAPNSPLAELQYLEHKRALQKRKLEKEQRQIAKLQKKHAKRQQKKLKKQQQHQQQQQHNEHEASIQSLGDSLPRSLQRVSGVSNGAMQQQQQQQQQQHQRGSNSVASSSQNMQHETNNNRTDINHVLDAKVQAHLQTDLCTFVMNQMSLTQQFFGNFENEIVSISEELLIRENEYNQKLEEHSILLTSPLDMAVAKWIHYKPLHGVEKHNAQLLQRPVMYVVFENIDIARPNDANYDSITPLCKMDMETEFYQTTPCKEDYVEMLRETKWKGYVRLKLKDNPKLQQQTSANSAGESAIEDIYTDGSSSGYSSVGNYVRRNKTASTTNNGDESDYDYAFIAHLNTQHPLTELKMSNQHEKAKLDAKVLPESCVSSLSHCMDMWQVEESDDDDVEESDDDDEDENEVYGDADMRTTYDYRRQSRRSGLQGLMLASTHEIGRDYETVLALKLYKQEQERRRTLMQQRYLNSKQFMRYFGELVREKLAQPLCIPAEQLLNGSYRGCSIYTKEFEIVPAIYVAQNAHHWPDCAFQFRIRDRAITTSSQTGQQFQWPTRSMIKRIETFGFHLIPIGYAPKKTRNPFRDLEWRIVFPKAESYLERHLTNSQSKIFMITKALLKTFVECRENNKALMFALDHIRVHLFWECERNFTDWPEEFLGDVLLRFISSFMVRLREKCLRDFFIEERNLFESIPEYSLVTLYTILADILANPVMHLMVTFRYLHFPERFFPKLNIRKIFDNLVENDMFKLRGFSKNARHLLELDKEDDEPLLMVDEGAKGLVGMKQHREKTQGKLRRKTHIMKHNLEIKKKQDYELRRRSIESIDVEFFFTNNMINAPGIRINQGVENLRRTNILEIFLDHLLDMCERAVEWRTLHLAKIYLTQAHRLCKLYHNYGCDMGAKEYFTTIVSMEGELAVLQDSAMNCAMNPPSMLLRPSVEPVRPFLIKEFLENRDISTETRTNIEQLLTQCEKRLSVVRHRDPIIWQAATPELKKSIKFEEHVVEVHEGDSNPIQKPQNCSPVSILRSTSHESEHLETTNVPCSNERSDANSKLQTKLTNTISTAADLIRNAPLANAKVLNNLASSTEKILTDVTAEERRMQLQDMIKKKTIQLKGIFNQSTES